MRKSFRVQHTWLSTALIETAMQAKTSPGVRRNGVVPRSGRPHEKTSATSSGLSALSGGRLEQQKK